MRVLVAGFGNVFFSDDAFGPQTIRALAKHPLGEHVRVRDFGISGMHLALEMLEAYDLIVLVDAIRRDGPSGTLYVIEPDSADIPITPDAHAMDVTSVLALYTHLSRDLEPSRAPRIVIVGCVPEHTGEGMELSAPVAAAIPRCIDLIERLVQANPTGASV